MDKKKYKRIDWPKHNPIEKCVSSVDTNGNVFSVTLNPDGEWVADTRPENQMEE